MKEIAIADCLNCPISNITEDGMIVCESAKFPESRNVGKLEVIYNNHIPEWCPLEDYGTHKKWEEAIRIRQTQVKKED